MPRRMKKPAALYGAGFSCADMSCHQVVTNKLFLRYRFRISLALEMQSANAMVTRLLKEIAMHRYPFVFISVM